MQETSKLAFYWGAVGSVWLSQVKYVLKVYQKHPVEKYSSSKVSEAFCLVCTLRHYVLKESWFDRVCAFTGWPRLRWVVTDTKYLTKPSKDWQPHIPTANTDTAYIEVRRCRRQSHIYMKSLFTLLML